MKLLFPVCAFLLSSALRSVQGQNINTTHGNATASASIIGYYSWSWDRGSQGPQGSTLGVAFSGWVDPQKAIDDYKGKPALKGDKYCSVGGGNDHGAFSPSRIQKITQNVHLFKQAGYDGVCYDVEEVSGDCVAAFTQSFAACKAAGLKVLLTTSHSAPYKTDRPADAVALVKSWVADPNIDILSPQLYSGGEERRPDFAETDNCKSAGCTWNIWKNSKAQLAPSLVAGSQFSEAQTGGQQRGLNFVGYVQWQQV